VVEEDVTQLIHEMLGFGIQSSECLRIDLESKPCPHGFQ
jgi:cyanate lyase